MKIRLIIFIILVNVVVLYGQNAPITTATTINNPLPGSIMVPITITDFVDIGAISLSLDYDFSVLNYVQGTPNPAVPGWFVINDNDLGNGFHRIMMGWYGSGFSLPDSCSIMDIEFTYISGTTSLSWYDCGGSCEYADNNNNVLYDTPTDEYYIIGYICGTLGIPGSIAGSNIVCQGESSVQYSIDTVLNATEYFWSVPVGASIITGQNTNAITVDFSDTAVFGLVSVHGVNPCGIGPSEEMPVTVNDLPVANAGNDTIIPYGTSTILYAAQGGEGSYSYYWTPIELLVDPYVQNPQTVNLTTSNLFNVEVTNDSTNCVSSDDVMVSITGGSLSVNPISVPGEICSGSYSQLYSNAGGGSNNYTYLWTSVPPENPPWTSTQSNPIVSPDGSRNYQLEVSDGFNITNGETSLVVYELPSATISGGDILCGDDESTILTFDFTGTPPWSTIYSNGLITIPVSNIISSPYLISVADSGIYVILEVYDATCEGTPYGYAHVQKYPLPQTPVISQSGGELSSNIDFGNQWYFNDMPISGATESMYLATVSGVYYDIVTLNTCVSDTSNVIDVVIIDTYETAFENFKIIPNPANEKIYIKSLKGNYSDLNIKIISVSGLYINEYTLSISGDHTSQSIDVSSLKAGLYFLQISNDEETVIQKLLIQ